MQSKWQMNSEDKIKKDNFMNKKANNLIESENEKLMSPEELFIYNEEQNFQSEINDLEEGKLFALNTLRQEENSESEKLNYVLDKLSAARIEVVADKELFKRILERENLLQKMQGTLTSEEYRRYFKFNEEDVKRFFEQINEWQKDNSNPGKLIIVGKAPAIMKVLGISEHFIEVEQSTLDKMVRLEPVYPTDKDGHNLTINDIYDIPLQLADPVMVFKSRTRPEDSYVFFTERKDYLNRAILIPLAIDIKKGRIVIHEITSMYGRREEIEFVKSNIEQDNLIYADKVRYEKWADEKIKELQKQKKSNGERVSQIQFLGQRFTDIGANLNILTKERLVNFISSQNQTKKQNYVLDNQTYGFAYEGKIYLNPDIMNSEVAVHEYTHLWDNYIQRTNSELWEKGKEIFKDTYYWNEIKSDPNYTDIKNNDDLVLSEIHSRICGKIADTLFERIAETDGKITKDKAIDWDKETWDYIYKSLHISVNHKMEKSGNSYVDLKDFLAMPMKDLMNEKQISNNLDNNVVQKYTSNTSIDKEMNKITISDIRFLKSAGLDTDKKSLEKFAFIKEYFLLNTKNLSSEEKNLYAMIALEGFNNPKSKNYSKLGEFLCGKKPENLKTRLLTLGYLKELSKKYNLNNTENIERLKLIKEKLMNQQNGFYSLLQNNGISKEYKAAIIERALKYELAQPQKQAILNMAYENAKSYVTEKTNSNTYSFKRR